MKSLTHSVRSRLMLLMLVAAIPAFVVIGYFAHWLRGHEIEHRQEEMLTLAKSLADKHRENLDDTRLLLASLARMPEIRLGRGKACLETLTGVHALARPHIANLFIVKTNGDIGCFARGSHKPLNVADMPWFRGAAQATGFLVGEYHISRRTGAPALVLSHTVREHGRVVAVLAAALDLSWLAAQPYLAGQPATTAYAIFDNTGTILLRQPATGGIGHNLAHLPLWRTLATLREPSVFQGVGGDGVERLFAYAPLGPARKPYARLVVGMPPAALDARAQELFLLGLAGLAMAMGLGLLAGWFGGEALVLKQLRPVLETVQRVAGGDLGARTTRDRARDDEISKLASEVDRMAEALSRRDQALTEARDRAQAYLDIVGVMVLVLNGKGNIALANLKTCEVLGCKTEACNPGINWFENWVAPDDRPQAKALFEHILAGDDDAGEFHEDHIQTAQGKRRLVAWRHTPLRDKGGRIIGVLSAGEDITEKKHLQEEQERLQTQLQQAQKMEALGQLTGGIAHDFNNILASVLGFAKLALRRHTPDPNSELAEYLREVIAAGERARDLVAQMLAFSRTQPGRSTQPMAPLPLVKEVVKMLTAAIPAGIRIETHFEAELPHVAIDPVSFHQILMNLVINARDALAGEGHIDIGLSRRRLERRVCAACHEIFAGDYLELMVRDDGQGIPPDVMLHIFEPFFTTKEIGKGSGMGLAMVHGLVRRAGGHFQVESKSGRGATFRIYLPVSTQEQPPGTAVKPALPTPAAGRKGRVLLVDDEAALLRLLTASLEPAGWLVTSFDHPRRALTAFRAAPDEFDAIISDQAMPDMTGNALIQAMHALRPNLPAILCTGFSDALDQETARQRGINRLFLKPVDTDELLAALAEMAGNTNNHARDAGR